MKRKHLLYCICAFFLFIIGIFMFSRCAERLKGKDYYIPELEMYLKFEKIKSKKARVYFSRTKEFESDYLEYTYYPDGDYSDIFYLAPNRLYVIDGGEIIEAKHKDFDISVVNDYTRDHDWWVNCDTTVDSTNWHKKAFYRAMKDSVFLKDPHYHIQFGGLYYFVVFDSTNDSTKIIFDSNSYNE